MSALDKLNAKANITANKEEDKTVKKVATKKQLEKAVKPIAEKKKTTTNLGSNKFLPKPEIKL